MSRIPFSVLLLAGFLVPFHSSQAAHRPTAREIASLDEISALRLSPDGERMVYLLNTSSFDSSACYRADDDLAGWTMDRQLWLVFTDGGEPRQLTFGAKPHSPNWSPDGTQVAFLREAGGATKIQVLPLAGGGEANPVDSGDLEPVDFAWSPDGTQFAFIATPPLSQAEKKKIWRAGGTKTFGEDWRNDRLYVMPVAGGEPRAVSDGSENVVAFDWAPDGRRVAVLFSQSSDPYYVHSLLTPKVVDVETGEILRVLAPEAHDIEQIAWSPDGRYIACETGVGTLSLMNTLCVNDLNAGVHYNAVAGMDASLNGFVWAPDAGALYVHNLEGTKSALYRVSPDGEERNRLGFINRILDGAMTMDHSGRYLAAVSSTAEDPDTPTLFDLKREQTIIAADVNPQVKDWALGETHIVRWINPENVEIEGILYLPPGRGLHDAGALLVLPHGGPDAVTQTYFSPWSRYFAGRGYAVFRPNYRGGFGYGYDFYAANRGRFGEIEQMDIESGVDYLISEGIAAPDSLVYGGWSWGGYITEWTIGHTTRYKAAVSGAGVSDPVGGYADSDINHGVAAEWEYTGNPWTSTGKFDQAAPWRSFKNVTTPTLILHGGEDDRVPLAQSIILYRALTDLAVPTRFYIYPREPHGPNEPAHNVHILQAWGDWYDHFLRGAEMRRDGF